MAVKMVFKKAQKTSKKLRMAIPGPSGSGKTLTALYIASALGEKIAVIDTERGGSSLYADAIDFDSLELDSYHPNQYIEALNAAADAGYDVVVIDSLSHAWFGKDGELELVDKAARQSKSNNTYFAWRDVTPLHNKLVDAILQSPCHVIVTLRSKTSYVIESDRNGKQVPRKVGLAPIQKDGLEYEFDMVAEMDHDHTMIVTKSRFMGLADLVISKPDASFGAHIKDALTSGAVVVQTPVNSARVAHLAAELNGDADTEQGLVARIDALLEEQGLSREAIAAYWAKMDKKYGGRTPMTLNIIFEQLQAAAEKRRVQVEAPVVVTVRADETVDYPVDGEPDDRDLWQKEEAAEQAVQATETEAF